MTDWSALCVLIPTINEAETIGDLCTSVFEKVPGATVLIVDDNSTDGTPDILHTLKHNGNLIEIIQRDRRQGIGSAHKAGFEFAMANNFEFLLTMDADMTHRPQDIPELLRKLEGSDVAFGSRFLPGGGLDGWSHTRRFLTYLGHVLTRIILGFSLDSSTAFRAYRLSQQVNSLIQSTKSNSYSFFLESAAIMTNAGVPISEIPVVLPSRTYGNSKMRIRDLFVSIYRLIEVRIMIRMRKACSEK